MIEHTWRELERADMDTVAAHAAEMEYRAERTCRNIRSWDNHDFECSSCGYELYPEDETYESDGTMNYCPNCGARVTKSDQYL